MARSITLRDGRLELRAEGYAARRPREDGPPGRVPSRTPPARPSPSCSARPLRTPRWQRSASGRLRAFVAFWRDWQKVEPRVFKDTEITDADAARYSLLLIGGPEARTRVAKRLASRCRSRSRPDAIVVDGRAFPATDAGVSARLPEPAQPRALRRGPRRHVGRRPVVRRLAERRVGLPDRGRPQRRRRDPRPARPVPGAGAIASGYFDGAWRSTSPSSCRETRPPGEGDAQVAPSPSPSR